MRLFRLSQLSLGCTAFIQYLPLYHIPQNIPELAFAGENKFIGPLYVCPVTVGSDTLEFVFDTSQETSWILSKKCLSGICIDNGSLYDSERSPTASPDGSLRTIKEGKNTIQTHVTHDSVHLGKISVPEQAIGEVKKIFGPQFQTRVFDGVLGLSARKGQTKSLSLIENLVLEQVLGRNIVGIWLQETPSNGAAGEISLGGVNTRRFLDKPVFVPVRHSGSWELTMHSVSYGNGLVVDGYRVAAVSTASYLISGPEEDMRPLHRLMGFRREGNKYKIACEKVSLLSPLELNIGGHLLQLTPAEYTFAQNGACYSVLAATRQGPQQEKTWFLGTAFMRAYYTLLNHDNGTVGFARSVQQQEKML